MMQTLAFKGLLAAALITSTWALAATGADDPTASSWFGPEFGVLQKVYDDCQNKNDFTGCLKGKALVALTKAASQVGVREDGCGIFQLLIPD